MRKLKCLSIPPSYVSYLVAIRDAKRIGASAQGTTSDHKSALSAVHGRIAARYKRFENAVANRTLESIAESPAMQAIGMSLRSCYDNDAKGIRDLKKGIALIQGSRVLKYCPLCGTTLVATYDHYLPASLFPEFAVHPLNLVPCCATCNSTKGDDWLDVAGKRLYVHAYSDLIPAEAFLHVELRTSSVTTGVGAVFSIARPARFSKAAWSVIEMHFERLRLIGRYTALANDEIAEILADCSIYLRSGGTRLKKFLVMQAEERALIYGAAHWQAVLMKELAESAELGSWVGRVRN